jgi:hypothetical protein
MRKQTRKLGPLAAVALAAALIAGCGSSSNGGSSSSVAVTTTTSAPASTPEHPSVSSLAPVHGNYSPTIDPANFVARVDNPYFPLAPGTIMRYQGVAENGKTPQLDVATVLGRTKRILGVDTTVVRDTVASNGAPFERTFDWYAQDRDGNVWYFGEDSQDHRNGRWVPSNGSFQAGVDGAQPGIIMPGDPKPGDAYRQEYYPGHALDQARILGYTPAKVPYGAFPHTLTTVETSALEPTVREQKHYVRGVGELKTQDVAGSREAFQLVSVSHH